MYSMTLVIKFTLKGDSIKNWILIKLKELSKVGEIRDRKKD